MITVYEIMKHIRVQFPDVGVHMEVVMVTINKRDSDILLKYWQSRDPNHLYSISSVEIPE